MKIKILSLLPWSLPIALFTSPTSSTVSLCIANRSSSSSSSSSSSHAERVIEGNSPELEWAWTLFSEHFRDYGIKPWNHLPTSFFFLCFSFIFLIAAGAGEPMTRCWSLGRTFRWPMLWQGVDLDQFERVIIETPSTTMESSSSVSSRRGWLTNRKNIWMIKALT